MTYFTISAIKQANKAAGHHFFDRSAMKFFNSRVLPGVIGTGYFITSEQFDAFSPRFYSVRWADSWGHIHTVSEFQEFRTPAQARAHAKQLAEQDAIAWKASA